MVDRRRKGVNWTVDRLEGGGYSWDAAQLAVLMDIRDELQTLNRLLHCHNFLGIPHTLKSIDRKVTKPKKRKTATRKR